MPVPGKIALPNLRERRDYNTGFNGNPASFSTGKLVALVKCAIGAGFHPDGTFPQFSLVEPISNHHPLTVQLLFNAHHAFSEVRLRFDLA